MEAKNISKFGMIIAVLIIIGMNFGYLILARKLPTLDEEKAILLFGGSIVLVFSPIYLSIIVDKLVSIFLKEPK
jgi:hypothetical protein